MKDKLIQYVDLLFTGAEGCEDIKQEILQNTLDRYDDLIAEGKGPEAAYRLAIMGIGDVTEILGNTRPAAPHSAPLTYADTAASKANKDAGDGDTPAKKVMRAVAVGLYILCPVPLLVLAGFLPGLEIIGICGLLAMVAVATVLIMLGAKKDEDKEKEKEPKSQLHKSIDSMVSAIGLGLYFIVSFATQAWYITWIIFPLIRAVKGLINAILDLKEVSKDES